MKAKPKPAVEIQQAPQTPVTITVTGEEITILRNGARALELLKAVEEEPTDVPLITFGVLLELVADPVWDVVEELRDRYDQAKGGAE